MINTPSHELPYGDLSTLIFKAITTDDQIADDYAQEQVSANEQEDPQAQELVPGTSLPAAKYLVQRIYAT